MAGNQCLKYNNNKTWENTGINNKNLTRAMMIIFEQTYIFTCTHTYRYILYYVDILSHTYTTIYSHTSTQ